MHCSGLLAGIAVLGPELGGGDRQFRQIADSDRVSNWVAGRNVGGQISRICGHQLAQAVLGVVSATHAR